MNKIKKYFQEYLSIIPHKIFFVLATAFFLLNILFTGLHYSQVYYGNPFTWLFWLLSILFLTLSFSSNLVSYFFQERKIYIKIFTLVAIFYSISHSINLETAPWGAYALFDDAAWDIFFVNSKVFSKEPFQIAYYDQVGHISREITFHYYIAFFFKLFGHNLASFNIALKFLGFLTIFFTIITTHKILKNIYITALTGAVVIYFPLIFNHIYMGHRYAISLPLLTISYYFLIAGLEDKSNIKISLSGVFTALGVSATVMGKQYLYALVLGTILIYLFKKNTIDRFKLKILVPTFIISTILTITPLLLYIAFNGESYYLREKVLMNQFLEKLSTDGVIGLKHYIDLAYEVLFNEHTARRQFLVDYPIVPVAYLFLIIPGILIAFKRRNFILLSMILVPYAGSFVAGFYDFRLLIASLPIIICIPLFLDYIRNKYQFKSIYFIGSCLILFIGIFSSINYLYKMSKNPNYQYLLRHQDVAVSRVFQDIIENKQVLNIEQNINEFLVTPNSALIEYNTFICPNSAYAVAHLYLQKYNDKKY